METLYEKVMNIADQLQDEGIEPTVEIIQQRLTEKVSGKDVEKYLRLWEHAKQLAKEPKSYVSSKDIVEEAFQADTEERVRRRTEELKQSLALVRATLESTVDGILIVSRDGELVDWNSQFTEVMQVPNYVLNSRDEKGGIQQLLERVENPESLYQEILYYMQNPEVKGNLGEIKFKDGRIIERYSQPHIVNNEIVGRVWSFRDITQRKNNEQQMRLQSKAIEASPNGIFIIDTAQEDNNIIYVNPAFVQITGYRADNILNKPCQFFNDKTFSDKKMKRLRHAIQEERSEDVVISAKRKTGEFYWCNIQIAPVYESHVGVRYFVGICVDITDRVEMEKQLEHQATHDSLTDLPNRALLWDRLKQSILYAQRRSWLIGILFLDVDRFKIVNDGLGHLMGDTLIKEVGKRIVSVFRDSDTIARMGGDEFVILLPNIQNEKDVITCAFKLLSHVGTPYYIYENEINITASIGICYYPKDGRTVEELLKNADMAMYKAKDQGGNNFQFYSASWDMQMTRRLEVENHLYSAIQNQELELYYQPLYSVYRQQYIGCESLLRWHCDKLGDISPGEFIPIAEENGFIHTIGKWVFEQACQMSRRLQEQGYGHLLLTVNLSSEEIKRQDVVETVANILQKTGANPNKLQIEITERIVMHDIDEILETLHQLRQLGLQLAIDDFGKEYSSLSYLIRMPVDSLKIDLSFTRAILSSQSGKSIIKSILTLGHNLGMHVIVEGVEFDQQYQFFVKHGFDMLQGFYLAKPMSYNELEQFLPNYMQGR